MLGLNQKGETGNEPLKSHSLSKVAVAREHDLFLYYELKEALAWKSFKATLKAWRHLLRPQQTSVRSGRRWSKQKSEWRIWSSVSLLANVCFTASRVPTRIAGEIERRIPEASADELG